MYNFLYSLAAFIVTALEKAVQQGLKIFRGSI